TIAGTLEDLAATGDLDIAGDLLIQGSGAASTVVDGGQLDQVFQIIGTSDVTVSGLTIQDGNAAGWVDPSGNRHGPMGGAILNPAGSVTVSDSVFAGNQSPEDAGAIYNNGQLTIERSQLRDNQIVDFGNGGAIVNDANGVLTISDSQFEDNSTSDAGGEGGAIAAFGGTVSIDGSEFDNNIADGGGAIFSDAPSLTVSNSTFRGNQALQSQSTSGGGGAIYSTGSLALSNDVFDGNYSGQSGGAVYARGGLTVDTVWFANNQGVIGGALRGNGDISNVTFSHNWVEPYEGNSQGGAMSGGGTLTNVTFSDNWAIL
ncbi:MAG TPA: hypothetical protein VFV93_11460, partial [Thermomicrobiales bacterium]|nr:hypothetical protein [Thermomicrobiales bacterium]